MRQNNKKINVFLKMTHPSVQLHCIIMSCYLFQTNWLMSPADLMFCLQCECLGSCEPTVFILIQIPIWRQCTNASIYWHLAFKVKLSNDPATRWLLSIRSSRALLSTQRIILIMSWFGCFFIRPFVIKETW